MSRFFLFTLLLFFIKSIHTFQFNRKSVHRRKLLRIASTAADARANAPPLTADGEYYDLKAWQSGYVNCNKEVCEVISNDLPKDLKGTYYRNGPSQFVIGEDRIMHPFDGDGMIAAVTFEDGAALFRNRFVRTKTFEKERKAKRILTRGAFGTMKSGGFFANFLNLNLRNAANTHVIYWGERLLALFEAGNPHRIEADALRTIGTTTMNGLLKKGQPLTAHPKIDANTNRLIMFSQVTNPSKTDLSVFEFDEKFQLVKSRQFDFTNFATLHDFVVTANYYVFCVPPVTFNPLSFILGTTGAGECITMRDNEPTKVYIVPRNKEEEIQIVDVDRHFNFHYSNAYENENGDIVLDTIRCPKIEFGGTSQSEKPIWEVVNYAEVAPFSRMERYIFRNSNGKFQPEAATILSPAMVDFPIINPSRVGKKHNYVYSALSADPEKPSPLKALIKIDLRGEKDGDNNEQRWYTEPHEYIGEPVFALKRGANAESAEDDGYLLTYLWNGRDQCTELLVFDAKDITKGPTHRVPVPVKIGHGLHGSYVPDLLFNNDDINRKFKAFSALDKQSWNVVKSDFSGLGISYDF